MLKQSIWQWLCCALNPVYRWHAAAVAGTSSDARLQKAYRFQQGRMDLRSSRRLARPTSDISTAIFSRRKSPTPSRPSSCSTLTRRSATGNSFAPPRAQMLWPHIDAEYQQELQGIADGVKAHGVDLDVYDIVALNAFEEVPDYYVPWLNKQQKVGRRLRS